MVPEYYKGIHGKKYRLQDPIIMVEEKRTGRTLFGFSYIFVRYLSLSRLICKEGRW